MKSAIVLLSGGMDSAVTSAMARKEGFSLTALTFTYGQRHTMEVEKAKKLALSLGVSEHRIVPIDLRAFGGSALTSDMPVPKERKEMAGIPVTYVPARNTIFLSYALALAEVSGTFDIFIGVNAIDFSGYPDCRPEFLSAFERLANLATRAGVEGKGSFRIHAPLLFMSKKEIVRKGFEMAVDFSLTHSCYDPSPDGLACGQCDACRLRLKGFSEAGIKDPIPYRGKG